MGTLSLWWKLSSGLRRSRRRRRWTADRPLEVLESRVMLAAATEPFEQHFDFGTTTSALAADHVRISAGNRYTAAAGYGWSEGSIQHRDRGASHGDERVRDFNFSTQATFAVDVPVGVYEVTLTLGDGLALRDEMGISLEEEHRDTVTSAAGQYETRTFTVTVLDGQLTLGLQDLGGESLLVPINALDVVQIGGHPAGPQLVSATPGGEVFDTLPQFTVTFNEEIDAATFTADDVTLSGPDGVASPIAIAQIDGVTFEIQFASQTAFGEYTLQIGPDIADLDGRLMNQDGDDVNGEAAEDTFSSQVTLSPTPEFLQTYDFGTSSSPVGPGANQVSESSTYTGAAGFGWTDGTIDSRDRGDAAGSDLSRDFNLTTGATFVVDVLESEAIYDVTLIFGDQSAARDEMGVFLEGAQVDAVSTAAGEYVTRTFRVTVSDGQLTLRLEDLGGVDTIAVINSLQVRHVETVMPPDDDGGDDDGGDDDGGDDDGGGDDNGGGDDGGGDDDGSDCERDRKQKWWKRKIRRMLHKVKQRWHDSDSGHSSHGGSRAAWVRLISRFDRN